MKKLIAFLTLFSALSANAGVIFLGSFNVYDGAYWEDNPEVYSAREVAALVYGGVFSDYAISTDASLDPLSITHTANYAGWGLSDSTVFNEDYKLDLGGAGYNSYQGGDQYMSAFSAYVSDGVYADNFVWRLTNDGPLPVSAPGTLLLAGLGLAVLATLRWKKMGGITA